MRSDRPDRLIAALIDLGRAFSRFAGRRILVGGGLMLAGAALEGMSLALLVPLIALLTGRHGGRFAAVMDHLRVLGITTDGARLGFVLVLFVAAMTARAAMLAARDRVLAELQLDFIDSQRTGLVEALAASRWQDIAGLRHARITHALGSEIPRTATALNLLLTIATAAVMLFAQWLLVLLLSPTLALLAIVLMALAVLGSVPMMRHAGDLGHAVKGGGLALLDAAGQLMGGLKLALAQNLQTAFVAEFRKTVDDLAARQRGFVRRQGRARIVGAVVASVALAAAVLAGRWLALSLATLVASLAVLTRMFGPATAILRSAQQLAGVLPSSAGLAALRRELERNPDGSVPTGSAIAGGVIRFEGVCYSHARGDEPAGVRDVTVTIAPGEIVGVTGASGAGKTSFVDLLCGLIVPDRGTISVADAPLDSEHLPRWRDRIAYVAQDTYLFHGTIRRNLSWGLAALDEDALWRALDLVDAAGIVRRLDHGLDAIVGERGTRLSGGERQRLAIARAILRVPDLLILDEATNALDLAAERRILDRVTTLERRPTILLVSHRVEALRVCGRLLTFDAGRLVSDSTANRSR